MDPLIFETNTNVADVDTMTPVKSIFIYGNMFGGGSVNTYTNHSSLLLWTLFCLAIPAFIYIAVFLVSVLVNVIRKDIDSAEIGVALLMLVGMAAVLAFSVATKAGPEGKSGMESVIAYYDKDKVAVKDIQGSWLYKNHDFVQKNVKNNSYLKGFDIHCDDEMKIPEQEKRSVLCGGDVLSPVTAKNKEFGTEYWLLADFHKYLDDGHRESDPRIAKIKKQEKDEENPIKLSMVIEEKSV